MTENRIGDYNFVSWWLRGTEDEAELAAVRTRMMAYRDDVALFHRLIFADPEWTERYPNSNPSDGYPAVGLPPAHIQGPNVRALIARSRITAHMPRIERVTFTGTLTREQLAHGRAMVRRAARANGIDNWDDASVDMYIDELPPQMAAKICGMKQWLGKPLV